MKTYEMIEYADNVRFRIHNITRQEIFDEGGNIKNVLDHWHREVEVVYTYEGMLMYHKVTEQQIPMTAAAILYKSVFT